MRFRSIQKWNDLENSKNLLFFAQIVDELLFDFSLDTYKPSAMNPSILCNEALLTIINIDDGVISRPNLTHILDELHDQISKDEVAQSLISQDLGFTYKILKDPGCTFEERKTLIGILLTQLDIPQYKSKIEKLIEQSITDEQFAPSRIRALARSYITTLINFGYSQIYINKSSQNFFFYGANTISGNNDIKLYFELFKSTPKEYTLVYKSSKQIVSIKDSCIKLGIQVHENTDDLGADFDQELFKLGENEVYISILRNSLDKYRARSSADKDIEQALTVYKIFNHKEPIAISSKCIIFDKDSKSYSSSPAPINTMLKCSDSKSSVAAKKMNQFVPDFSLAHESFLKFHRAAELHSMALESRFEENQLINLWIALESIVPVKWEDKDISKIKHIVDSITPVLNINYFDTLMNNLLKDLIRWNRRELTQAVTGIPGTSLREKLTKIIVLEIYKTKRERLEQQFGDFHLLRDRFSFFVSAFSSPKTIGTMLEKHTQRVGWQIRRIYRARNMIVHSGKTPSFTNILIENTHDYLDTIMKTTIKLSTHNKKIRSIQQAFMYANIQYSALIKWLSKKDTEFSDDNINRIIGNPLATNDF
ncbi:hypothetical protein [uncultured Pseudodesulfovibrio sp.]|uniref:hypothetical protein n=1 Tax=uncultured Pseudodesulfovibrio sp. TaxID=2035858 RepID=UPI0029C99FF6|nr:hypothetical protein [uncultured Pseudodesulfovibrio sp.]